MFLRFAVVFLEYSENFRLIRGEKKESLKMKNTSPKMSIIPCLFHISCATTTLKKTTDRLNVSYLLRRHNNGGCYIGYEPARGTSRITGALPFPNLR